MHFNDGSEPCGILIFSVSVVVLKIFRDKLTTESENSNDEQEVDKYEDEKYLEKLKKDREWDDWKDGLYKKKLIIVKLCLCHFVFLCKGIDLIYCRLYCSITDPHV